MSIRVVWVIASDFPFQVFLAVWPGLSLFAVSRVKLSSETETFHGLNTRIASYASEHYRVCQTSVGPFSVE